MNRKNYNVLGVMSGTSLDGVDIAFLHFRRNGDWSYDILKAETIAYPEKWQILLAEAINYNDDDLEEADEAYTRFLAEVISDFIQRHEITDLDAVCSHGHTIKHEPENGYTLQIGNKPALASILNQRVVCDFRIQDVELGGQGAPLVPIGDQLLFSDYEYCLNLGGFANISTRKDNRRIAFDICAVNTVLNFLAQKAGAAYDAGGRIAASGSLDKELYRELSQLPFYDLAPPKSLGIEWVNKNIFPLLEGKEDVASVMHTYAVHAVGEIAAVLDQKLESKVLVTGGGAFNEFLMNELRRRAENKVVVPSPEVVNFKEALIFGLLGVLRLRGEVNVLSSVTGARKDHSSGRIYVPAGSR